MTKKTYLDYNATAPLRPGVYDKICNILNDTGNASSIHSFGRTARQQIEHARKELGQLLNTAPENIIFNSGATEANNTVLRRFRTQGIVISAIEHPCVMEAYHTNHEIPVTGEGIIDLNDFEETISHSPPPALVSVMLVNNETGVIQPIRDMAEMCNDRGIKFHTDAAQAIGRIPVSMNDLGCHYMTLSSHKMGGPQGVGALVVAEKTEAPSLIYGGGQERGKRAGTENVSGIAGFGSAAHHARTNLDSYQKLAVLQKKLETGLKEIAEDVVIFGERAPRVANTTCFSIPETHAETMVIALDLEGVALSSGSACSSGRIKPSHVLGAMGVTEELRSGALRISTGWTTKESDINHTLDVIEKVIKRIRS